MVRNLKTWILYGIDPLIWFELSDSSCKFDNPVNLLESSPLKELFDAFKT
jgi:hypothetical protein